MQRLHSFLRRRPLSAAAAISAAALVLASCVFFLSFSRDGLNMPDDLIFTDRQGRTLRHVPDAAGQRHIWTPLGRAPSYLSRAFIAAEDARFYYHPGFDAMGILRAFYDNLKSGRIVSGASTITQQLCRIVYPRERTYRDKFIEILRAARLELYLSKDEILQQYLNRVPMGSNIQGVGLASRYYFGRDVSDIGLHEAAILASLPKAPGRLNPLGGDLQRLRQRQSWVLGRMLELGYITLAEYEDALDKEVHFVRSEFPFLAPHAVDTLIKEAGQALSGITRTSIEAGLQSEVERAVLSHRERLRYKGARQAAAIVVHNRDLEVLAHAGSLQYGPDDGGFNDGASSLRSAGSTLKPILYALALEEGYTASTVIDDVLRKYQTPGGDYVPLNYNRKQYGPVTVRSALGNSLNISAIKMLEEIGVESFYSALRDFGLINHPENSPEHYGLGLVIGNPEVSLRQLVAAYATFANGGLYRPLNYGGGEGKQERGIFSEETAFIISDILADPSARSMTFGSSGAMDFHVRASVKTGTSTLYRDAWAVGYTDDYTVGVWVGNFEGDPTFSISGASGAAPILKDLLELLYRNRTLPIRQRPSNLDTVKVCGISGMRPGPNCMYVTEDLFIKGTEPLGQCSYHTADTRPYTHDLPAEYVPWVYEKNLKGSAAGYRLAGFDKELDQVFDSRQSEDSAVVVRGVKEAKTSLQTASATVGRHFSIGMGGSDDVEALHSFGPRLLYPRHGDRYLLGLGEVPGDGIIVLEAAAAGPAPYLDWFIDKEHYQRTRPPYQAMWHMEKGLHEISVVAPGGIGDSVTILVE